MHPSVRSSYLKSTFPYNPWAISDERLDALAEEAPLDISKIDLDPISPCIDRQHAKRFYRALTAHWLAIEVLRLVAATNYDTATQWCDSFEEAHVLWQNNPEAGLQDTFEALEVYDFV